MAGQYKYSSDEWKERQAEEDAGWRRLSENRTQPRVAPERPYGEVRRALYGSWWTFVAALMVLGEVIALGTNVGSGLLALALGALAGRYAYRIWTWQARSLWFVIFF